jgi:probable dihydroxyacetone kinase regulator
MTHEENSFQTKKTLSVAFKELLKHKSFSKITVSELVRECNINRKTFYYHFEDIYALLKWTLEQETFEVVRQFDLTTNCQDAFLYVIGYIEQNSFFLNCIYDSLGRDQMKRFLYHDLVGIIDSVIQNAEQELSAPLPGNLHQFLTEFYTEGIAGMFINTFQENHALRREDLIEYFSLIVRTSIPATVKQAAQKP